MASKNLGLPLAVALSLLSFSCKKSSDSSEAQGLLKGILKMGTEAVLSLGKSSNDSDLDPSHFDLEETMFPREDIALHQTPGSDLTDTPRELQGIWWMDGNPIGDETVTFAHVDFTAQYPLIPVYGAENFSFHGGNKPALNDIGLHYRQGVHAFMLSKALNVVYEFHFKDGKYDDATIVPTVSVGKARFRVLPEIAEFGFKRISDNLYLRSSSFLGNKVPDYNFRRILVPSKADPRVLEKTEFWDSYAAATSGPAVLRLSKKKP